MFIFNEWPTLKSLGQLEEHVPIDVKWLTESHTTRLGDMTKGKLGQSSTRSLSRAMDGHGF